MWIKDHSSKMLLQKDLHENKTRQLVNNGNSSDILEIIHLHWSKSLKQVYYQLSVTKLVHFVCQIKWGPKIRSQCSKTKFQDMLETSALSTQQFLNLQRIAAVLCLCPRYVSSYPVLQRQIFPELSIILKLDVLIRNRNYLECQVKQASQ